MNRPPAGYMTRKVNQIGFLDVADTPYQETIAAGRDIGRRLY